MSSPDHVRVPRMNDTTNEEKEYYKRNRLWCDADVDGPAVYRWRIFLLYPGVSSLFFFCLPVLIVGVWALVQGTSYFSIAMATNHLRDHSVSSTSHCGCGRATGEYFAYSFRQILRNT